MKQKKDLLSSWRHVYVISRVAFLELLFEKTFYLLVAFILFALVLALMLGQLTYIEKVQLSFNFMVAGIEISLLIFGVFMGVRLFQKELAMGSVSMILSKPILRSSFLLGKFFGQSLMHFILIFMMGSMCYLVMFFYKAPPSMTSYIEGLFMILTEVTVVTAITYLFSTFLGPLTSVLSVVCVWIVGHFESNLDPKLSSVAYHVWKGLRWVLPDFSMFNLKEYMVHNISHPISLYQYLVYYGFCSSLMYVLIAIVIFNQRDIPT